MEQFYTMAGVQASMFIYMAVGYISNKKGLLTKDFRASLTTLLINILLPCMVFDSFNNDIGKDQLLIGIVILLIAFSLSFMAWVLGFVLWRKYPERKASILRYGTLVANSGFTGLPVISGAYGTEGLFLASIFIIPNRILIWTAGISLFQKGKSVDWVKKVLLNPGIIAVFLGVFRMLLGIHLPSFVDTAIDSIGGCTTSISIMVVGAILADVDWKTIFEKDVFLASAVRLIALPIMALIILQFLPISTLELSVSVILTGMPIGSTTAILAEQYGADSKFASKCVFASTLLSLITIPMLTLLL